MHVTALAANVWLQLIVTIIHLQVSDIVGLTLLVTGEQWGFSAESTGCDINPYDDERQLYTS